MKRLLIVMVLSLASIASASAHPGRPAGCPSLWCGCWARIQAGLRDPSFNLAKHWLTLRHVAERGAAPVIGAWAVMSRRNGGGHVGKVVGVDANGNPVIISGNHGRVGVGTGVYPRGRIIAYVKP